MNINSSSSPRPSLSSSRPSLSSSTSNIKEPGILGSPTQKRSSNNGGKNEFQDKEKHLKSGIFLLGDIVYFSTSINKTNKGLLYCNLCYEDLEIETLPKDESLISEAFYEGLFRVWPKLKFDHYFDEQATANTSSYHSTKSNSKNHNTSDESNSNNNSYSNNNVFLKKHNKKDNDNDNDDNDNKELRSTEDLQAEIDYKRIKSQDEKDRNHKLMNSILKGQTDGICYNQFILLEHIKSGRFLTVINEPIFKLSLTDLYSHTGRERCFFSFEPTFKFRAENRQIYYGDKVAIRYAGAKKEEPSKYYLSIDSTRNTGNTGNNDNGNNNDNNKNIKFCFEPEKIIEEIRVGTWEAPFEINMYGRHREKFDNNLKTGDLFRLYLPEIAKFLRSHEKHASITFDFVQPKDIKDSEKNTFTGYGCWLIEMENRAGGYITSQTTPIRIKHLTTGMYLTFRKDNGIFSSINNNDDDDDNIQISAKNNDNNDKTKHHYQFDIFLAHAFTSNNLSTTIKKGNSEFINTFYIDSMESSEGELIDLREPTPIKIYFPIANNERIYLSCLSASTSMHETTSVRKKSKIKFISDTGKVETLRRLDAVEDNAMVVTNNEERTDAFVIYPIDKQRHLLLTVLLASKKNISLYVENFRKNKGKLNSKQIRIVKTALLKIIYACQTHKQNKIMTPFSGTPNKINQDFARAAGIMDKIIEVLNMPRLCNIDHSFDTKKNCFRDERFIPLASIQQLGYRCLNQICESNFECQLYFAEIYLSQSNNFLIEQVGEPLKAAEFLTDLMLNDTILENYISHKSIDQFIKIINKKGIRSQFLDFFKAILSNRDHTYIVTNQELCLNSLIFKKEIKDKLFLKTICATVKSSWAPKGIFEFPKKFLEPPSAIRDEMSLNNDDEYLGKEIEKSKSFPLIYISWSDMKFEDETELNPARYEAIMLDLKKTIDKFGLEWVAVEEFCWVLDPYVFCKIIHNISFDDYKQNHVDVDEESQKKFDIHVQFAEYFVAQIDFFSDLCGNRSYNAINYFEKVFPYHFILSIMLNDDIPYKVRSSFADLMLNLWIDRFPHQPYCGNMHWPSQFWTLDSLGKQNVGSFPKFNPVHVYTAKNMNSNTVDIKDPFNSIMSASKFRILFKFIYNYLDKNDVKRDVHKLIRVMHKKVNSGSKQKNRNENMLKTVVEKNYFTIKMLNLLKNLVLCGFMESSKFISAIVDPMMKMLDADRLYIQKTKLFPHQAEINETSMKCAEMTLNIFQIFLDIQRHYLISEALKIYVDMDSKDALFQDKGFTELTFKCLMDIEENLFGDNFGDANTKTEKRSIDLPQLTNTKGVLDKKLIDLILLDSDSLLEEAVMVMIMTNDRRYEFARAMNNITLILKDGSSIPYFEDIDTLTRQTIWLDRYIESHEIWAKDGEFNMEIYNFIIVILSNINALLTNENLENKPNRDTKKDDKNSDKKRGVHYENKTQEIYQMLIFHLDYYRILKEIINLEIDFDNSNHKREENRSHKKRKNELNLDFIVELGYKCLKNLVSGNKYIQYQLYKDIDDFMNKALKIDLALDVIIEIVKDMDMSESQIFKLIKLFRKKQQESPYQPKIVYFFETLRQNSVELENTKLQRSIEELVLEGIFYNDALRTKLLKLLTETNLNDKRKTVIEEIEKDKLLEGLVNNLKFIASCAERNEQNCVIITRNVTLSDFTDYLRDIEKIFQDENFTSKSFTVHSMEIECIKLKLYYEAFLNSKIPRLSTIHSTATALHITNICKNIKKNIKFLKDLPVIREYIFHILLLTTYYVKLVSCIDSSYFLEESNLNEFCHTSDKQNIIDIFEELFVCLINSGIKFTLKEEQKLTKIFYEIKDRNDWPFELEKYFENINNNENKRKTLRRTSLVSNNLYKLDYNNDINLTKETKDVHQMAKALLLKAPGSQIGSIFQRRSDQNQQEIFNRISEFISDKDQSENSKIGKRGPKKKRNVKKGKRVAPPTLGDDVESQSSQKTKGHQLVERIKTYINHQAHKNDSRTEKISTLLIGGIEFHLRHIRENCGTDPNLLKYIEGWQMLKRTQRIFAKQCDIIPMILYVIQSSPMKALVEIVYLLGVEMLQGGNDFVQNKIYTLIITDKRHDNFIQSIASRITELSQELTRIKKLENFLKVLKKEKASQVTELENKVNESLITVSQKVKRTMNLLQMLCEGHYFEMQEYLREQNSIIGSFNIISLSMQLYDQLLQESIDISNKFQKSEINENKIIMVTAVSDFIIEALQGRCPENQQLIAYSNIGDLCKLILIKTEGNDENAFAELRLQTMKVVATCFESREDDKVHRFLAPKLNRKLLNSRKKSLVKQLTKLIDEEAELNENTDGKDRKKIKMQRDLRDLLSQEGNELKNLEMHLKKFHNEIMMETDLTFISELKEDMDQTLSNRKISKPKRLNSSTKITFSSIFRSLIGILDLIGLGLEDDSEEDMKSAEKFLEKKYCYIEVDVHNKIIPVNFMIPKEANSLTETSKEKFLFEVDLSSHESRINALSDEAIIFIDEMKILYKLRDIWGYSILKRHYTKLRTSIFVCNISVNLALLFRTSNSIQANLIFFMHFFAFLALAGFVLCIWFMLVSKLQLRRRHFERLENNKILDTNIAGPIKKTRKWSKLRPFAYGIFYYLLMCGLSSVALHIDGKFNAFVVPILCLWFIKSLRNCILIPDTQVTVTLCLIYDLATDNTIGPCLIFCVTLLIGMIFNPYFYPIALLDILALSPTLRDTIRSVIIPAKQLALTLVLFAIMLLIFTSIATFAYGMEDIVLEDDLNEASLECDTLINCMMIIVWGGVQMGDITSGMAGVPESGTEYFFKRFFFDMCFFIICCVILFDIVTGVILDTFGSLRDETASREKQLKNECYVCGLTRTDIEAMGNEFDFDDHLKKAHSIWSYLFFIFHVRDKPRTECTGVETYVKDLIDDGDNSWFPKRSFFNHMEMIQENDIEEEEAEDDQKIQEIHNDITSIIVSVKRGNDELAEIKRKVTQLEKQTSNSGRNSPSNNKISLSSLTSAQYDKTF